MDKLIYWKGQLDTSADLVFVGIVNLEEWNEMHLAMRKKCVLQFEGITPFLIVEWQLDESEVTVLSEDPIVLDRFQEWFADKWVGNINFPQVIHKSLLISGWIR